ncbi:hypothetical protein Q3G72_002382 [Acer saccharum]|nr:hypothetical protein Q3G72_002382 [Acer saccharum]
MVGVKKDGDGQPQYDPYDPDQFFSFKVHHSKEFNGDMDEYVRGGAVSFYGYITLDKLSMLDLDDIAMELGYTLPVGYWIQVKGYGKLYSIANDQQLMWFAEKIPASRVVVLFLELIVPLQEVPLEEDPLQEVEGNELVPYQEHGPSDVNEQGSSTIDGGKAKSEAEAEVEGQGEGEAEAEAEGQAEAKDDADILVESDYEQETDVQQRFGIV